MSRAGSDEPLYRSRPGGGDILPAQPGVVAPINDFIHCSPGLSNSYLIVTPAGRVVVNTGMGFEGPIHRANFDGIDGGPIRYVLFTQGHVDHVGGAECFREAGTEIVAQAGNAAHQADDARIARFRARRSAFAFADAIARAGRHVAAAAPGAQARPEPSLTFEDRLELELGGLRVELLATPGGETRDSMVVWLPEHRICFTGNLFSALFGHFPNLVTIRGDRYREPLEFVRSLDRVLALEPEQLLVGHHEPVSGAETVRAELERLRGAVLYVHDETVRGMNGGTDVHTLMREMRLPSELAVGEGYGRISWSVRAIWECYAGWFHARSTTELYAVPPWSVHEDLAALAGGPEPIAARAAERARSGDLVEAIHLAEVALAGDPDCVPALRASLEAHQGLHDASENFWETRWLEREIAALRGRLEVGA